ncbi:sigma-70 family RNA polymerase sigma factor [Arthrobacter sp. JZ12]|uniref:RNA polymerase sigma factor n=1 Tax=Arthrobacter sp. JZ12 TaxID=2654190 RepID=UPI002B47764E|nr:sigma-70 family RNA polymerase sigma factor [Arthrobacter sp. JZ12]WRH23885.1 sigma-70 family RNA polymerase sigma factor [Arthrobacter sp. JZ12]
MSSTLTEDLLGAAQAGDTVALNCIYTELSPKVLGYLTARGVDDPEAVTQDVFLSVFSRLSTISGGEQGLRTFAFSVAHARSVDEARKRSRRPAMYSYDPSSDDRTTASAETAALDRLSGDRALQQLQALKADQREVLALRIIADLPLEDVARVVGKSPGAVKQLQRRGLIKLKQLIVEKDSSNHGA